MINKRLSVLGEPRKAFASKFMDEMFPKERLDKIKKELNDIMN